MAIYLLSLSYFTLSLANSDRFFELHRCHFIYHLPFTIEQLCFLIIVRRTDRLLENKMINV